MSCTVRYLFAIVLCAGMMLAPALATSTGSHAKRSHDAASDRDHGSDAREEPWERDPIAFSARDREAIRTYYGADASDLPLGLAKRQGSLLPGLQKHLQRNGTLPHGLQERIEPLSPDLERGLSPLYSGYARGIIGQDVVIVETRTQRIMDIIRNVTGR